MAKNEGSELTDKQKIFVLEYLVDLNATQAAIRAGYSEKSARCIASENMDNPKIQAEIQRQMDARASKVGVTSELVLGELLKIATFDIRRLYNADGSMLKPSEWPDDVAKAVAGVDIEDLFDGHGEDRQQIGYTKKVKIWDKPKSLELLGRHLKLFTDKIEVKADLSLAETMRKARERAKHK
nr:terminase small subunit [Bdellovibrio sp. HM001]